MGIILKDTITADADIKVTAAYCMQRAAEALHSRVFVGDRSGTEVSLASEWRQLGMAIATLGLDS